MHEVAGGLVVLLVGWLLATRLGEDGVSAFTLVNDCLFGRLMIVYGIADALQLLVAQNFGAQQVKRIRQFMLTSAATIAVLTALVIALMLGGRPLWITWFFREAAVIALAEAFMRIIRPILILSELNILISSYLTALHKPTASAAIALLRSLLLPIGLLLLLPQLFPDYPVLLALPLAEWLTFAVALVFFLRYKPSRLFRDN